MSQTNLSDVSESFQSSGYAWLNRPLDAEVLRESRRQFGSDIHARRNVLNEDWARSLATHHELLGAASKLLGARAFATKTLLFAKRAEANWLVPWHQDRTIAVSGRQEAAGYGPWSTKAGVIHVQPPKEVLERSVALRIHLDDCPQTAGALRVLPGTHRTGYLDAAAVARAKKISTSVMCEASQGDVLAMSPLLLHASSAATAPQLRRVIHIEYSAVELALPLEWRWRVCK